MELRYNSLVWESQVQIPTDPPHHEYYHLEIVRLSLSDQTEDQKKSKGITSKQSPTCTTENPERLGNTIY